MKEYQRRFLCVLLAALFLLFAPCGALAGADEGKVLLPGEEGFRYEGEGFDTPEDAALYYLAGLKNQDFEQMLAAFALFNLAYRTTSEIVDLNNIRNKEHIGIWYFGSANHPTNAPSTTTGYLIVIGESGTLCKQRDGNQCDADGDNEGRSRN